jgi:methionyl-tRNA formyltransferase
MQPKKIVFLASDCASSRWVYHALKKDFFFEAVIIEQPVSKTALFKGRLKKAGLFKVAGQAMFSALIVPFLKMKARKRKAALINQFQLQDHDFDISQLNRVQSVNDDLCLNLLQHLQPDIVIVNGTRIISKKILQSIKAVFINMHVGITPMYRGSHGGYWALYQNDATNFGTSIHVIDAGVDTGAVIKQVFTKPAKEDNFTTYPVLQTGIGIAALKESVAALLSGNMQTTSHAQKGNMFYQPTIWQYLTGPVP